LPAQVQRVRSSRVGDVDGDVVTPDPVRVTPIFITTRASVDETFPSPTNLSVVNSDSNEYNVFLTSDERELFFSSNRTAGSTHHLFRALRGCD
jgi:hypothetical protein